MSAALYCWRAAGRQPWRRAVAVAAAGVPAGIAAGHWAWAAFASSLGVAPVTVVPGLAPAAGFGALLLAGNLLAAIPATVAARTRPAALLRAG